MVRSFILFATLAARLAAAQTCENHGIEVGNGSDCLCPTGFGGPACSQLGCGGTLFQGSQRPLTQTSTGPFANLTASGCACQEGWAGVGCNVCQTSTACQAGFNAVQGSPTTGSLQPSTNDTIVCNQTAEVYASSQMSCSVVNPTLQAIYPLDSTLNIIRTLQPSLSPLPNTTSFGVSGTVYAQLLYAGVEQFYCHADSCTQSLKTGSTTDRTSWECSNLQCKCRSGTTFCGGVPASNLTSTINTLGGALGVDCGPIDPNSKTSSCFFKQSVLQSLFGSQGLALNSCGFGECVRQGVIDSGSNSTAGAGEASEEHSLSSAVIAGLAVVGALVLSALAVLLFGLHSQRAARRSTFHGERVKTTVTWSDLTYIIPGSGKKSMLAAVGVGAKGKASSSDAVNDDKVILDNVSGTVHPGQMMAILGPSGAGKTTLVDIISGRGKSGITTGSLKLLTADGPEKGGRRARIGFVPQQDVLPSTLTVFESLLFAARLRLPESISDEDKHRRVEVILDKLGISSIKHTRIGDVTGNKARGISGGEMRRVTIGLELIADPDVLLLDEPTSGLDSVSASRVANVLYDIAHDPVNPISIIASIHQPSSQLYHKFDSVLVLSHGRSLYSGPGGFAPATYFSNATAGGVPAYQQGYNVAEYLLDVASDPPVSLFQSHPSYTASTVEVAVRDSTGDEKARTAKAMVSSESLKQASSGRATYSTTFLTQLQYLCGREWKILKRDRSLFVTHVVAAALLGVFCGGLYYKAGITIAGFQSRVGCLFFLGALIAFSALSALYNVVEVRPLFLRERSSGYYSPTAWLLSRFFFDVIPLRLIPTVIVATIVYWMAGLAPDAAHFFKYLLMLVLYSLAMTLFNFLLGTLFQNGGIAILLSALSGLYQMTFAGFFVHLNDIPPVLRWLQWICPLKYLLEGLAINEVDSGLMIEDTLQGVPISISAALIMHTLFGFDEGNYYRNVLIMMGFILGFVGCVIGVVWAFVRERR